MIGNEPLASQLASLVAESFDSEIDARTNEYTKLLLLSCLGAMLGGARLPAGRIVAQYAAGQQAVTSTTVAGTSLQTSPELAALVNGTAAHATEYEDDSFPEAVSTFTIIPPLLAAAEQRGMDGRRLLTSIVIGHEIQSRLGLACLGALSRGFQLLPLMGAFGTAGATAGLIGLPQHQITTALSLAASQAAGMRVQNRSMTHFLESGTAGRAGILAAYLAESGFDGVDFFLEGLHGEKLGFLAMVGGPSTSDPKSILGSWGSPFRILDVGIKKYPGCFLLQPAMHGLKRMRLQQHFRAEDVDSVVIVSNSTLAEVCDIRDPRTHSEAAMSLHHVVASAITHDDVTLRAYSDEFINNSMIRRLREQVQLVVRDDYPAGFMTSPMEVTIRLKSGPAMTSEIQHVHGLPPGGDHMDGAEVVAKFQAASAGVISPRRMDEIVSAVDQIESMENVRLLTSLLAV